MTTPLTEFVFFLSTAEEEADVFIGSERNFSTQQLRYKRDLPPGTYEVVGQQLLRIETPPSEEPSQLDQATASVGSTAPNCTGWIDQS